MTVAETVVLECLSRGQSVAESAEALGLGVSTVRTRLLRIFDKTGAHRQSEPIALVASFDLPIGE